MFLIGDEDKFGEVRRADAASAAEWLGEAVGNVTGSPKTVSFPCTDVMTC